MIFEIHSFEPYEDFICTISDDPRFADPHFLFSKDNLYGALGKKDQHAFAALKDGKAVGLFVWLILEEESYAEMVVGLTKDRDAFAEMLARMEQQYVGIQMDFVVHPKHDVLCGVLKEKGAAFDAEQQKMILTHDVPFNGSEHIELYSSKWEKQYCAIHRKDTYWTAEKVLAASDRFRVFLAVEQQQLIGYLDITYCFEENEPYDLYVAPSFAHQGRELALLGKAIACNKPHCMMTLIDVAASDEIALYQAAGFTKVEGQNSIFASYRAP